MNVSVKYLRPNSKTGMLEFRRTFPSRLLPFVTDETGKKITEVKRSLGVRTFDAARDGPTYADLNGLYDLLATRAEKIATGTYDALDAPKVAYLAEIIRSDGLAIHDEVQFTREPVERKKDRARALLGSCASDLADSRQLRALGDVDGMIAMWGDEAFSLAENQGLHVDRNSDGFARLCSAVNDAQIDVWAGILGRLNGDDVPTPPLPAPPPVAKAPGKSVRTERTFQEIALELIDKPRLDFKEPTKERVRGALRFLEEAVGILTPAELTRERVTVSPPER